VTCAMCCGSALSRGMPRSWRIFPRTMALVTWLAGISLNSSPCPARSTLKAALWSSEATVGGCGASVWIPRVLAATQTAPSNAGRTAPSKSNPAAEAVHDRADPSTFAGVCRSFGGGFGDVGQFADLTGLGALGEDALVFVAELRGSLAGHISGGIVAGIDAFGGVLDFGWGRLPKGFRGGIAVGSVIGDVAQLFIEDEVDLAGGRFAGLLDGGAIFERIGIGCAGAVVDLVPGDLQQVGGLVVRDAAASVRLGLGAYIPEDAAELIYGLRGRIARQPPLPLYQSDGSPSPFGAALP
jgi:hypothetical protein